MRSKNLAAALQQPIFDKEKQFDPETAQKILKEFYLQAKREMKRNGKQTVRLYAREQSSNLTFVADGFTLDLTFTKN